MAESDACYFFNLCNTMKYGSVLGEAHSDVKNQKKMDEVTNYSFFFLKDQITFLLNNFGKNIWLYEPHKF